MDNNVNYKVPPFSKELPAFKFPQFEINSDTGLKVYFYQDKTTPLVTLKFFFANGNLSERIYGISQFTSLLLSKGTRKRTALQISQEIDLIGAGFNCSANPDDLSLSITALAAYLPQCFELLKDIIYNPTFPDEEIERQKKKSIAGIRQELANPETLAQLALTAVLFHNHPYGKMKSGTPDDIASFERPDCLEWYENTVAKQDPVIIVAGNFDRKDVIELISEIPQSSTGEPIDNNYTSIKSFHKKIAISEKSGAVQIPIRLGMMTINRDDPMYPHLHLLNNILGGYFLSRLNKLLREDLGLTYGVGSSVNSYKKASYLNIGSSVNFDSVRLAVELIIKTIDELKNNEINPDEFNTARQHLIGGFLRSIENAQQIAAIIKLLTVYDLPVNYFDNFYSIIKNLHSEDLLPAQRRFMNSESLYIAAAGSVQKLNDDLSCFGEIAICNEYGEIL